MNILIGSLLLAYLLACCIFCMVDICAECRFQTAEAEREELLEQLWVDE